MRRFERPNDGRYLTFSCFQRLQLFRNERIRDAFVGALREARERDRFRLFAWVVMPEHVHLYVMPAPPGGKVAPSLWRLKRDFAKLVIRRWRRLGAPVLARITDAAGKPHFWLPGGGYDRNIHSDSEHHEKITYINENPVRRGLVARSIDWRWSSARWYVGFRDGELGIDPTTPRLG